LLKKGKKGIRKKKKGEVGKEKKEDTFRLYYNKIIV